MDNIYKIFQIGDFCFSLTYPPAVVPPPNFMIFERCGGTPQYAYRVRLAETLPEPRGTVTARRADIAVFDDSGREQRLIGVKGRAEPYALYREVSQSEAEVFLQASYLSGLNIDPVFSSLLALERRLNPRGGLILHCAYLRYREEAILFSAPSETGKTTQANLWEKYRPANTINGDKSLLQCVDGRWTAQGWPVCGTSEVCHDLATPIRAIVMLSQAKQNTVQRLRGAQAFAQVYSQITVNTWNRGFVQRNMDLIEQLCMSVPVWHLGCTISAEAVDRLEKALYPEG